MSTNLFGTFQEAEDLNNKEDWTNLEKLLHDDVVMFRVDDNEPPLIGRPAVKAYLKNCKDKFYHRDPVDVHQQTPTNRSGVVKGLADWTDTNISQTAMIRYNFVFNQDPSTKNWKALVLKGWIPK